jgi:aerobic-type carbon monoxide dehydrogenase small subunit (CoxS/CutS family)
MRLTINGRAHELDAPPGLTLLELLRGRFALTGTKLACNRGECGACTVQLDGEVVYSCLTLAAACDGTSVVTVEGLAGAGSAGGAGGGATLTALQEAFIAHDATQCGFCTPGQLMAAHTLLARTPHPTDDQILEAMSGNLCRCGTYPKIVAAIRAVAKTGVAGAGAHGA